jgi:hypothetical protein
MTPQERQLVDDLFDRLTRLETAPRDPDAERAILDGLKRAPNAVYALVQTALVQDEALKRADARIRELSGETEPQQQSGFLDAMRNALGGGGGRASVPSVGASVGGGADPRWNRGGTYQSGASQNGPAGSGAGYAASPGFGLGGGSFLGTAAASAAGAIGGALLLNSISSMFGHHGGSAFASTPDAFAKSPWDNSAAASDLARDAGLNDIGANAQSNDFRSAGLFDSDNNDAFGSGFGDDADGDFGGDFDGGDSA